MSSSWTSLLADFPRATESGGAILNELSEGAAATVVCALPNHGVLTVTGPDASKFLQGQTTTDFEHVSEVQSRLGCYISLKGRVITSFRAVQQGESIHLVMDNALITPVKDKLAKYIVFSKASLNTSGPALLGLAGPDAAALLDGLLGVVPAAVDAVTGNAGISVVRLHGAARFLLLVNPEKLQEVWSALAQKAAPAGENAWRLRQIEAGVAVVTAPATELFQPQELNYQLLDGVSYSKGCYTGQEIVARLYFRGKLKQHVQRFSVSTSTLPIPGTALFAGEKHVADVVLAAHRDTHRVELLAVARPEHAEHLHLASSDGPALQLQTLPYAVPVHD
jgi:folate-binding protein YgfZ